MVSSTTITHPKYCIDQKLVGPPSEDDDDEGLASWLAFKTPPVDMVVFSQVGLLNSTRSRHFQIDSFLLS